MPFVEYKNFKPFAHAPLPEPGSKKVGPVLLRVFGFIILYGLAFSSMAYFSDRMYTQRTGIVLEQIEDPYGKRFATNIRSLVGWLDFQQEKEWLYLPIGLYQVGERLVMIRLNPEKLSERKFYKTLIQTFGVLLLGGLSVVSVIEMATDIEKIKNSSKRKV